LNDSSAGTSVALSQGQEVQIMERTAIYLTTAVGGHYLASLIQMSLHRVVGHRPLGGPIHRIHMLEHHGIPHEA